MAGHQLMGGVGILMLMKALGQHIFLARLKHREFADFVEIAR